MPECIAILVHWKLLWYCQLTRIIPIW